MNNDTNNNQKTHHELPLWAKKITNWIGFYLVVIAAVGGPLYWIINTTVIKPYEEKTKQLTETVKKVESLEKKIVKVMESKNYLNLVEISEHIDKKDLERLTNTISNFDLHNKEFDKRITKLEYALDKMLIKEKEQDHHIQNLVRYKNPKGAYNYNN